jgi:uncharacterized protein (TIGR02246 family)
MMTCRAACLLLALLPLAAAAGAQGAAAPSAHARDSATVRSLVVRSGEAANAGDPDAVMALYARDVVLSYPGVPDQDYATLARGYREMLRTPGVTLRTTPTFEEILVSGDLAVVRVIWTTTLTQGDPARETTRRMKDLQVWRRESDGTWKFARGMHFRMAPPAAAAEGPPSHP